MTACASDPIQLGRRRVALALPLLACGLVVPSVQAKADVHQSSQILMGTRVDLTLQGNDSAALGAAAKAAFTEMTRLADMMSRYRSTSVLSAINLMAGLQPVSVPPELLRVLQMARQAGRTSGGAFDSTVGSLRDWDFDPQHPSMPSPQRIAEQLSLVDRFGDIAGHADSEEAFTVSGHGVGRKGDHGKPAPGGAGFANAPDSFDAIHDGHVDIEKDEVEFILHQRFESLAAVGGLRDDGPLRLQEKPHDLPVDRVVVGEQDACAAQTARHVEVRLG